MEVVWILQMYYHLLLLKKKEILDQLAPEICIDCLMTKEW